MEASPSLYHQMSHELLWRGNTFGRLVQEENPLNNQKGIPLHLVPLENQPMEVWHFPQHYKPKGQTWGITMGLARKQRLLDFDEGVSCLFCQLPRGFEILVPTKQVEQRGKVLSRQSQELPHPVDGLAELMEFL